MQHHREEVDLKEVQSVLFRYCLAMTESKWDAEDLVQEALLRALPVLTGEKPHLNPTAYVLRIAKNSWIDRKRRQRFETTTDRKLCGDMEREQHPEPSLIDVEAAMEQIVRKLPPIQITVFLLRDVFKYTAAEVADWLQTTEGAVKAALHRARVAIRALHANPSLGYYSTDADPPSEDMLEAYMHAFRQADPQALVLLALARTKQVDVTAVVGQFISAANMQSQARASVTFEAPYAHIAETYAHFAA